MRVLIYGINYAPEPVGVGRYTGEMAEYLAAAGHEVRVVTALPYYPDWKVSADYNPFLYARERQSLQGQQGSIDVHRAPLWVPFRPGGRKRVLHLLSFAATSIPLMVRSWFWRPDVVWMAAPAFVCAPMALATAKLTGAKSWIHVQDYEIDIAFGMGLISGSRWKRLIFAGERWLLNKFDKVSTISRAMMDNAHNKGVARDKTVLVPNWADISAVRPLTQPSSYRKELVIPNDGVVALYSGSMGMKQGVDWVAEAAVLLKDNPKLYFVICGDGTLKEALVRICADLPRVKFLPLQPLERLGELLGMADIHLLPQRADAADLVMPSKITGMLASGRPVVGMAEKGSELAGLLNAGSGIAVPHGDVEALAAGIEHLVANPAIRYENGIRARALAERHFDADVVLNRVEREMRLMFEGDSNLRAS